MNPHCPVLKPSIRFSSSISAFAYALGDGLVMFGSRIGAKQPCCAKSSDPPRGFCFLQFYSCWSAFSPIQALQFSRRIPPSSNRAHSIPNIIRLLTCPWQSHRFCGLAPFEVGSTSALRSGFPAWRFLSIVRLTIF